MPPGTQSSNLGSEKIEKILEAIRDDNHELLDQLLKGVALNQLRDEIYPLHESVGQVECVKVLLGHGADPDQRNQEGKQAIHLAVEMDYVETLILLVIQGADYNSAYGNSGDNTDGLTPLQIAIEKGANTCQDFLLFIGAKIPDEKLSILEDESKSKYQVIQQGFTDGKIVCGGKEIRVKSGSPDYISKPVDIGFHSDEPFSVYVRKMEVAYQSSNTKIPKLSIPDGQNLISDIYQYRVDKNVQCDVYIPASVLDLYDNYHELVVGQMTNYGKSNQDIYTDVHLNNGKVVIKDMKLYANGSCPIVSFGIFAKIIIDRAIVVPNEETHLQSSVQTLFEATVPAGSAPADTQLQLKVMKAENIKEANNSGNSEFGNHTDFYSVENVSSQTNEDILRPVSATTTNSSSNDDLQVTLPKPNEESSSGRLSVMSCRQGKDGTDSSNWTSHKKVEIFKKTVICKAAAFANYIAVHADKAGYHLKVFVSVLYAKAMGDTQTCKLFATVKPQTNACQYLVLVDLCQSIDYKERLQERLKSGFREQECGPTSDIEINTKCVYMLKLNLKDAQVILGPDSLPIQYQGDRPKSQTFTVEIDSNPNTAACGSVLSFKRKVPKDPAVYGQKCKVTLAIMFNECKTQSVSSDAFFGDTFIERIARTKVGDEWFSLGVCIGFCFKELLALQDMDPYKRNEMILCKWRDKPGIWDEKLDSLFLSIRKTEIQTLTSAVLGEVIKFHKRNEELNRWIQKYTDQGSQEQMVETIKSKLISMNAKPVSPMGEKFQLFTADRLGGVDKRVFVELDLTYAELEENIPNRIRRNCKFIMMARDKCPDCINFLKKLTDVLKNTDLILIEEMSKVAKEWFESEEAKHTDSMSIEALRAIFG